MKTKILLLSKVTEILPNIEFIVKKSQKQFKHTTKLESFCFFLSFSKKNYYK
jgi:hypothetical protein